MVIAVKFPSHLGFTQRQIFDAGAIDDGNAARCLGLTQGRTRSLCSLLIWKRSGRQRLFAPSRTPSASSHTSHALRQADRRAEWQGSWGFRGGPVDWKGAETAENRSPEANSLRTS